MSVSYNRTLSMPMILHLCKLIKQTKVKNLGKRNIPNSKPEMFDDYIKEIDEKLAAIS